MHVEVDARAGDIDDLGMAGAAGEQREDKGRDAPRHGHQNWVIEATPGSSAAVLGSVSTTTPAGGMPR